MVNGHYIFTSPSLLVCKGFGLETNPHPTLTLISGCLIFSKSDFWMGHVHGRSGDETSIRQTTITYQDLGMSKYSK